MHAYLANFKKERQGGAIQFGETKDMHRSKPNCPCINMVEYNSENSEFVWPSKDKRHTCDALKPTRKNREDELTFSFDVAKRDRIFDAMLKDK
jgi:hypothetical protein